MTHRLPLLSVLVLLALASSARAATSVTPDVSALMEITQLAVKAGDFIAADHYARQAAPVLPPDMPAAARGEFFCSALASLLLAADPQTADINGISPFFSGCFTGNAPRDPEPYLALLACPSPVARKALAGDTSATAFLMALDEGRAPLDDNLKARLAQGYFLGRTEAGKAFLDTYTPGKDAQFYREALAFRFAQRREVEQPLRVVMTGFEPFADFPINPSYKAVLAMDRLGFARARVFIAVDEMPVVYDTARPRLLRLLEFYKPQVVIPTGLAASSAFLRIEQTATNSACAAKDNRGKVWKGPLAKGLPAALDTPVDVRMLVKLLRDKGFDARMSKDAGGYLCNFVYFHALHHCRQAGCTALFVHVPLEKDAWGTDKTVEGLTVILKELLASTAAPSPTGDTP